MSGKPDDIKVRVPAPMKRAIKRLADERFTTESEIAREAILQYLAARDIILKDEPSDAPAPATKPVTHQVNSNPAVEGKILASFQKAAAGGKKKGKAKKTE